jgi:multicomponent Na+:H+ antiporter subunit C
MSSTALYGLCGAALMGLGLFGLVTHADSLRKILSFNLLGSGIFLLFGAIARRAGLAAGVSADPVPQALAITGLVVAFAATALAVALLRRLVQAGGRDALDPEPEAPPTASDETGDRP